MQHRLTFRAWSEDSPGPRWQAHAAGFWPGYRRWFERHSRAGRQVGFLQCRKALREHMPELAPTWERLVELNGGGDECARFLSMWCPPPYMVGCSQGVWLDPAGSAGAALVRNYDFAPTLLDGTWMATRWLGRRVLAMSDCLWGVLDGINESGLAASLSFGGSTAWGPGFGIPLILRYVLESCGDVAQACDVLRRVPSSMSYNVTVVDAAGRYATVFLAPDRPGEVTDRRAVTNFQHAVQWPQHARATQAELRLQVLAAQLASAAPLAQCVDALLYPPLYQASYSRGFGTLYTSVGEPAARSMTLVWPGQSWRQTIQDFADGDRTIVWHDGDVAAGTAHADALAAGSPPWMLPADDAPLTDADALETIMQSRS